MESLNCPDASGTDEEAFAAMIEIAEREAPGTVPYFRWIEEFAGSMGEGGGLTSSGDCETDIDGSRGGHRREASPWATLTMSEVVGSGPW